MEKTINAHDQIADFITEMTNKHRDPDGRPHFIRTQNTNSEQDDESSLQTSIWISNDWIKDEHDEEQESLLINEIYQNCPTPAGFKIMDEPTSLNLQLQTQWNDFIRLQITDHSIYLITLNSGQH